MSLFDFAAKKEGCPGPNTTSHVNDRTLATKNKTVAAEQPGADAEVSSEKEPATIYEVVLPVILNRLEAVMSSEELAKSLDVNKTQLNVWLKKAVAENRVIKLSRPVRYQKAE